MNSTFGPATYDSDITREQEGDAATAVVPAKFTTWWISGSPWVTYASLVFAYSSGIVGTAANILVLVVDIRARQQSGTGVNTLITKFSIIIQHNTLIINQSVLDLFSCFFSVVGVSVWLLGFLEYKTNGVSSVASMSN